MESPAVLPVPLPPLPPLPHSPRLLRAQTTAPAAHATEQEAKELSKFTLKSDDARAQRNARLQAYLQQHNVPILIEALVTALAVEKPDDVRKFVHQKLCFIRQTRPVLTWDVLLPLDKHPSRRPLPYYMFRGEEEDDRPSPEMYARAHEYNSRRLLTPVVRAWVVWYRDRMEKKKDLLYKLDLALKHYNRKLLKWTLKPWIHYRESVQSKRREVIARMRGRQRDNLVRVAFMAWREFAANAKLTAAYFAKVREQHAPQKDLLTRSTDSFTSLPPELRLKILSMVTLLDRIRCSMVCRAWREVAQDPALWAYVRFSELEAHANDKSVESIIFRYRPFISHINLRGCAPITSRALKAVGTCRNLQDLNLSDCQQIRDAGIKAVAEGCTSLIYLNLACCSITDLSLKFLAKHCRNLGYLSLAGDADITDRGAAYLSEGQGCKKLYWLDLSSCIQLTNAGLLSISSTCTNLGSLLLNDLPRLSDAGLAAIAKNCIYLSKITLHNCPRVTDEGLIALGTHCKCLLVVEVAENDHVTAAGFEGLAKVPALKHIVVLRCKKFSDRALAGFSRHPLTYLDLSENTAITDGGLKLIGSGAGPGAAARNALRSLLLRDLFRMTDTGLRHLARGCSEIIHLDLTGCTKITDTSVTSCINYMPNLTHLLLIGCIGIGDGTMLAIQTTQPNKIRWLDVTGCNSITDLGIEALGMGCPTLEHLNLTFCTQITDEAFQQLAFGCRRLQWLSVMYCQQLTDMSVQYLASGCPEMTTLHLHGLPRITNHGMETCLARCRGLRTLSIFGGSAVNRDRVLRARAARPDVKLYYDMEAPSDAYCRPTFSPAFTNDVPF